MKLKKNTEKTERMPEAEPDDWDFDFSMYEREEKQESQIKSITDNKPTITGFRSKYSASVETIQLLVSVRTNLAEKSIACASRTDDIKELWEFYGCINEAWAIVKDIYGTYIIDEIKIFDEKVVKELLKAQKESYIPENLYGMLLKYRDYIYMLIQRINLGLEVERSFGSHFDKAKKGITE